MGARMVGDATLDVAVFGARGLVIFDGAELLDTTVPPQSLGNGFAFPIAQMVGGLRAHSILTTTVRRSW